MDDVQISKEKFDPGFPFIGRLGEPALLLELDKEEGMCALGFMYVTRDGEPRQGRYDRRMLTLQVGPYYVHLSQLANPEGFVHDPKLWMAKWERGMGFSFAWAQRIRGAATLIEELGKWDGVLDGWEPSSPPFPPVGTPSRDLVDG